MTTALITGFGPFPGAPTNPTQALVRELARRRSRVPGVRRLAHVFATTYAAVDGELPALLARARPDALIMFGLAAHTRQIRIEMRARNVLNRLVPDAGGHIPATGVIAADATAHLPLRVPAPRLVAALRAAGLPAALSTNAGNYLCNYLSWRAAEAARCGGTPRLVAFVHVPPVRVPKAHQSRRRKPSRQAKSMRSHPLTFADLIVAGEAILRAALTSARVRH
jgi:pyroglutamyl-peptidase